MEKIIKKFIDFNFFILYAWEQGRDKFRKLWEKNLVGLNLILTFLHFFFLSLFFFPWNFVSNFPLTKFCLHFPKPFSPKFYEELVFYIFLNFDSLDYFSWTVL